MTFDNFKQQFLALLHSKTGMLITFYYGARIGVSGLDLVFSNSILLGALTFVLGVYVMNYASDRLSVK